MQGEESSLSYTFNSIFPVSILIIHFSQSIMQESSSSLTMEKKPAKNEIRRPKSFLRTNLKTKNYVKYIQKPKLETNTEVYERHTNKKEILSFKDM